jgi:glycerol-3-phosphate acyltransferase PlsY
MPLLINSLTVLAAYLLGSIPTSVWIGKSFFGIDVRDYGSGNAGATNTIRVLGAKVGLLVFFVDVLKGWIAVDLFFFTDYYVPQTGDFINFQLLLCLAVVLGHIFPVFAQFRGGKGVATMLGAVLAIHPAAALISIGIFTLTLVVTRYVSLSSMVTGFLFPVLIIIVFQTTTLSLVIFSLIIAGLMLFTHQKNIERLLKREESRFSIRSKLKSKP